ncbi:unnamed protein product [Caenorhabditis bovis]|uniref:JmjC domain-containing protein n=1 Tax=Caenorhabditis bovis TaxID=2654633 RepID=A0A8S1F405_9PELO|nr:unnamed protein product [Caenorhabditis bovis]
MSQSGEQSVPDSEPSTSNVNNEVHKPILPIDPFVWRKQFVGSMMSEINSSTGCLKCGIILDCLSIPPYCSSCKDVSNVVHEYQKPKAEENTDKNYQSTENMNQSTLLVNSYKEENCYESADIKPAIDSVTGPLKVEVKNEAESDDDEIEQKTPKADETCAKCKRFTHEQDVDPLEDQKKTDEPLVKPEPKQLMSKKKSHKHKHNDFRWIQCDHCHGWYHFLCSGLEQFEYYLYEKFHCVNCVAEAGPSTEYQKLAKHRYRWYSPEEKDKKEVEVGTETWIENFIKTEGEIPAPNEKEVEVFENGFEFCETFNQLKPGEWKKVYLIKSLDGIQMKVPDRDSFDIENVVEIMGPDYEVDTIDVYNQNTFSMKLSTFLKKIRDPRPRTRLYNFLSLEFSENQQMRDHVAPPSFVRDISMVDRLWPEPGSSAHRRALMTEEYLPDDERPKVEEFCLSGMANSYTDFHIDFGGSSVYYHIFKGKKVFYIAEPNERNLKAFEQHETTKKTHEWFGNKIPGRVKRVVIDEGQTLLIPAGWIHAVWTPKDSLVFGGNFLHLGNVEKQIRVYQLESAVRSVVKHDEKFYFPNFEYLHWYYVRNILIEKIRECNEECADMSVSDPFVWYAAKCLCVEMRAWFERNKIKVASSSSAKELQDLDNEAKLIAALEAQVKKQMRYQKDSEKVKKSKRKNSGELECRDGEYHPKKVRKSKKSRKNRDNEDSDYEEPTKSTSAMMAAAAAAEILGSQPKIMDETTTTIVDELPTPSGAEIEPVASIKIRFNLPNEDQQNARQMFNSARTSSGRKVKVNQHVMEYCGNIAIDKEDVNTMATLKSFSEYDSQLAECEAKSTGVKLQKKRKNAAVVKEKVPTAPKRSGTKMVTAKQRLGKILKL